MSSETALTPVAADTPVFALQGALSQQNPVSWPGDDGKRGWLQDLEADADGVIAGSGGFNAGEESMASVQGQMAQGRYFTVIGVRRPGGDYPEAAYGTVRFKGMSSWAALATGVWEAPGCMPTRRGG